MRSIRRSGDLEVEDNLAMLTSPLFWGMTLIVALIVQLATRFIEKWLVSLLGHVSSRWEQRTARTRELKEEMIARLVESVEFRDQTTLNTANARWVALFMMVMCLGIFAALMLLLVAMGI